MTDNDLLTLAYRAGLLDQIHILAAVDPQRADMQKVEGPAHRAVLEFGRAVLEKVQEADSTVWHSKKVRDKNMVWYDKVEDIDKSVIGTPARVEMTGTFTKEELLEIAEVLKEESKNGGD